MNKKEKEVQKVLGTLHTYKVQITIPVAGTISGVAFVDAPNEEYALTKVKEVFESTGGDDPLNNEIDFNLDPYSIEELDDPDVIAYDILGKS